jgi:hypothetical protein
MQIHQSAKIAKDNSIVSEAQSRLIFLTELSLAHEARALLMIVKEFLVPFKLVKMRIAFRPQ